MSQLPDTDVYTVRRRATCGVVMRIQRMGEGQLETDEVELGADGGVLPYQRRYTSLSEVRQETAKSRGRLLYPVFLVQSGYLVGVYGCPHTEHGTV